MNLIDRIVQFQSDIARIRRDIHAHPELKFEEVRTAEVVAQKLAEWGYAVDRGLGKTGVVGTLKVGNGSNGVGLRADMDALPLVEHNAFAHKSIHEGRMHACGHDGHTAMLLAAAQYLAESKNFDGTLHVIFQPAEEGGGGARVMIEDGLFDRFPCDAVFGMHNWPGAAVGTFGVTPGPMMASANQFEITITGKGAHAAMPHNGNDPIMVAVAIAQNLQTLITRNKKPIDTAVLSITQIHAGDAYNIIPNEAVLRGTVRTFTNEVLDLIESGMQRIVAGTAATFGAEAAMTFDRAYPPTINHPKETAFAVGIMRDVVGDANTMTDIEPTMGAEDFAFMLQARPGCYVFIGNGDGEHREMGHGMGPCMLHNPSYDFNDALIPIGATYWVRLAEKFLAPA
ncbi:MAG: M20 aminoacylase family protein [Burkholderiaceae bacterium]